jgi:hypothetical protein
MLNQMFRLRRSTKPSFLLFAQARSFIAGGDNKKLYDDAKLITSDEEMFKKIVIKSFKNIKDESPNIIDIDNETGEVRQISEDHDSLNYKNIS